MTVLPYHLLLRLKIDQVVFPLRTRSASFHRSPIKLSLFSIIYRLDPVMLTAVGGDGSIPLQTCEARFFNERTHRRRF